jgi:hypothetical protein
MSVFAEQKFERAGSGRKMLARVYEPQVEPDGVWAFLAEISEPLSWRAPMYGGSSFQAVTLALKLLSMWLYSSGEYARKEMGWKGRFGEDLGLPTIHQHLDIAPYPF